MQRGKTVATPDNIAIITMLGTKLLRANGLEPGKDVVLLTMPSHDAAVWSLQNGDSAAAIISGTALQQMPIELKGGIRSLASSNGVHPIMFMAHPKVPSGEVKLMTTLLLDFAENTPQGRNFMRDAGYLGLLPSTSKEMKSLDPYVKELKNLLAPAP